MLSDKPKGLKAKRRYYQGIVSDKIKQQARDNGQEAVIKKNGMAVKGITYRKWGYYQVLHDEDGFSVKKLVILPGRTLSDQRHFKRAEHWLVVEGDLTVDLEGPAASQTVEVRAASQTEGTLRIGPKIWHRPHNKTNKNVVVIETWLGNSTEEDIERR